MQKLILAKYPNSTSKTLLTTWKARAFKDRLYKSPSKPSSLSYSHRVIGEELQKPEVIDDSSNNVDEYTSNSKMTVHSIENVPPITFKVLINGLVIGMEVDSGSCYSLLNSEHWN